MSLSATEVTLNAPSTIPVLLVDSGGVSVSGVVKGDVDAYFFKAGETTATLLDPSYFDWTEIDATNMVGWYLFTINATGVTNNILDTVGLLGLQLNEAAGAGTTFSSYPAALTVQPLESWDMLRHILGLSQHNFKLTPTSTDSVTGLMLTGSLELFPDNNLDGSAFTSYTVTVAYGVENELTSHRSEED